MTNLSISLSLPSPECDSAQFLVKKINDDSIVAHTQLRRIITNEADGGREETGQILTPMIRDRNLQVLDRPGIFENVGQIRRHIHHVLQNDIIDLKLIYIE
jgi:hypothetical protein